MVKIPIARTPHFPSDSLAACWEWERQTECDMQLHNAPHRLPASSQKPFVKGPFEQDRCKGPSRLLQYHSLNSGITCLIIINNADEPSWQKWSELSCSQARASTQLNSNGSANTREAWLIYQVKIWPLFSSYFPVWNRCLLTIVTKMSGTI